MWQFLCGFSAGIYVGTYFECKPTLDNVIHIIKTNIPEKKEKADKKNSNSSWWN